MTMKTRRARAAARPSGLEELSDALDVVAEFAGPDALDALAKTRFALARRDWDATWTAFLAARFPWWRGDDKVTRKDMKELEGRRYRSDPGPTLRDATEGSPRDRYRAARHVYPLLWRGCVSRATPLDMQSIGSAALLLPQGAEHGLRVVFGEPFSATQPRLTVRIPCIPKT